MRITLRTLTVKFLTILRGLAERRPGQRCKDFTDPLVPVYLVEVIEEELVALMLVVQMSISPEGFRAGTPDGAVRLWLYNYASMISASAKAATMLMLHRQGKAAALQERHIFELLIRGAYFVHEPNYAYERLLLEPFEKERFFLACGVTGEALEAVKREAGRVKLERPDLVAKGRKHEIALTDMTSRVMGSLRHYATRYRAPSQHIHGTTLSFGSNFTRSESGAVGLAFDGVVSDEAKREMLENIATALMQFIVLCSGVFGIDVGEFVDGFNQRIVCEGDMSVRGAQPEIATTRGGVQALRLGATGRAPGVHNAFKSVVSDRPEGRCERLMAETETFPGIADAREAYRMGRALRFVGFTMDQGGGTTVEAGSVRAMLANAVLYHEMKYRQGEGSPVSAETVVDAFLSSVKCEQGALDDLRVRALKYVDRHFRSG